LHLGEIEELLKIRSDPKPPTWCRITTWALGMLATITWACIVLYVLLNPGRLGTLTHLLFISAGTTLTLVYLAIRIGVAVAMHNANLHAQLDRILRRQYEQQIQAIHGLASAVIAEGDASALALLQDAQKFINEATSVNGKVLRMRSGSN